MSSAKLELVSISSAEVDLKAWSPARPEDVFVTLDLEIGFSDGDAGINMFYVILATADALKLRSNESILAQNRIFLVESYDYIAVIEAIREILDQCSRPSWEDSCLALRSHFRWEYEDYSEQ
jgi:hypothetical protein